MLCLLTDKQLNDYFSSQFCKTANTQLLYCVDVEVKEMYHIWQLHGCGL